MFRNVHCTITDTTVDHIKIIGYGTVQLMLYPYYVHTIVHIQISGAKSEYYILLLGHRY